MGSDAAFAIDETSALGRRARGLLAGAGLAQPRDGQRDGGARVLLVDPDDAQLERTARSSPSRLVLVAQALPLPGDRTARPGAPLAFPIGSGAICARNQPYLESLLPRLALSLSTGR